ncbi:MAG: hypothetical protein DME04_26410 [Candidatus Rokuibacteriota bacterium]|nr:MAG: hypothetical protein DME04_26410 [Candidatus Rokubacteria bacterium]
MARRLCIVSGTPLQCNAFVPALESLRPDDELEIISDRRRGDASGEAKAERRSRPFLDLALKVDGFVIVPVSAAAPAPAPMPVASRAAAITPSPARERVPPASAFDRLVIDDEDATDRERLERILQFKRRRNGGPWVLAIIASAIVVVVAVFASPTVWNRLSQVLPDVPKATRTLPPLTEAPASGGPDSPSLPTAGPASAEPAPGREDVAPPARPPEPNTRAPRLRAASATQKVVPPPTASAAPPSSLRREMSPPLPGVPRVELSRADAGPPDGPGETYTVRVVDAAGRPLAGADILLLARMADGTAASIPLSSGIEPGTYYGTMPAGRSALVDLRVRVTTNDRRVEIPFTPQ